MKNIQLPQVVTSSASFTRPNDANAYLAKDCVSNSTSATTLMQFALARKAGYSGFIKKARLVTNQKTNVASYRLWLYSVSGPTVVGDNAPFTLLWANRANRLGFIDLGPLATEDPTGSDSASALNTDVVLEFACASGDDKLYGVLETLAEFTPAAQQQFFVELTAEIN